MEDFQIGMDIEEISRFKNLKKEDKFIKNNFTRKEILYCFSRSNPELHLAGFFCAKEALIKTLNNGYLKLNEIEVTHEFDKPKINIRSKKYNGSEFKLSIAHTKNLASAIVIKK